MKVKHFEIVSEKIIQKWLDENPNICISHICHPDLFNCFIYYQPMYVRILGNEV